MLILGLQSNASRHPCPWCDISSDRLNEKGMSRTIESIMLNYRKWIAETGGNLTKSKFYGNCVNSPLIPGRYFKIICNA